MNEAVTLIISIMQLFESALWRHSEQVYYSVGQLEEAIYILNLSLLAKD